VTSPMDHQLLVDGPPAKQPFTATTVNGPAKTPVNGTLTIGGRADDSSGRGDHPQFDAVPQLDFRMPSPNSKSVRHESREPQLKVGLGPQLQPQELGADLRRADLGRADLEVDRLPLDLGKLAHELRTPIGAIVALAEVIRDERFGALGNARYKGYANDIHQSAKHALAVLSAMLEAGPGPNGQADPRGQMAFEQIELNALARGCVSGLQPVAAKAGISLRTALNPRPLYLRADRRSLKQIVLNLLSNALKFTPAGGTITVATSVIVEPAGSSTGGSVLRLDVRDTGIGMTPELIADVLSRDIDSAPNTQPERPTGIGVPMAQALAASHGGRISIASDSEGATVSLYLPQWLSRSQAVPTLSGQPEL
jgi:signal transduction histidine kinase